MLPEAPLDINLASREELMRLPGIGPVLAERIVADRQANGPFRRVEDLTRIRGIKSRTLEKLRPYIFVAEDSSGVVRRAD
jgi:competence protein ComEA